MKQLALSLLLCTATLAAATLTGPAAHAAPRVGQHDGYTRLVFDLPAIANPAVKADASTLTVTLNVSAPAASGQVAGNDLKSYKVTSGGGRSVLTFQVTPGRKAKVFVLPGSNGAAPRLVVDVGVSVDGVQVGKALSAAEATRAVQQAKAKGVRAGSAERKVSARGPERPALRVVVDAGHGGADPGMVGYVVEKEVNLSVALKVRALLEARGVEVILTRDRDAHLSADKVTDLGKRAALANAGTVNAFLSIHVNAANPSAHGIETWVFGEPLAAADRALAVRENGGGDLGEKLTKEAGNAAQNLLGDLLAQSNVTYSRKLANLVQGKLISATGARNRGVGTNSFYVIRKPRTPAILIELGFGSHPVEGRKLADDGYRDRLALAIADAVAEFLHAK